MKLHLMNLIILQQQRYHLTLRDAFNIAEMSFLMSEKTNGFTLGTMKGGFPSSFTK